MGKYSSIARKKKEEKPQEKPIDTNYINTYKHSILVDTPGNPDKPPPGGTTNLRTTNLTNLTDPPESPPVVPCIHRMAADRCAVCAGYWKFLRERFEEPHLNTPASRRAFWEYGGPFVTEVAMHLRDQRRHRTADPPGPIA